MKWCCTEDGDTADAEAPPWPVPQQNKCCCLNDHVPKGDAPFYKLLKCFQRLLTGTGEDSLIGLFMWSTPMNNEAAKYSPSGPRLLLCTRIKPPFNKQNVDDTPQISDCLNWARLPRVNCPKSVSEDTSLVWKLKWIMGKYAHESRH